MNFRNIFLVILVLTINCVAKAQHLTNNILGVIKEHALVLEDKLELKDTFTLVKFNNPLSQKQLLQYKPVRVFSATTYVIATKNLPVTSDNISSKNLINNLWKASDKLIQDFEASIKTKKLITVRLAYKTLENKPAYLNGLKIKDIDYSNHLIVIQLLSSDLIAILANADIIYADIITSAKEEIVINGIDLSLNGISPAHALFPDIKGKDVVISVKEGMFDEKDLDFMGKVVSTQSSIQTNHATIMATLALGSGNSFIKGLGVAPQAQLTSSSFSRLLPDDISQLKALKVAVQNHSYGTDIENNYGIEATAYDKQVYDTDTLVHVFSAGNKGTSAPISGTYTGLPNYANLTGNFKQAKNILVIGGINRENLVETLSSKGPAYDGRVKPDLVALGEDGTSGAAAVSSGIVALLQQQYRSQFNKTPSSALIRSVLVNSADDLGTPNVDYSNGFGRVNALNALKTINENRFKVEEVQSMQDYTLQITVPANQKQLKVSLVWNDPEAVLNSAQSIVNHLDLSLETPSGQFILPWVLSTYPHLDSLAKPAQRKVDELNTVQQISLAQLPAGNYVIHVKARNLSQAKQSFAVAYQLETAGEFSFTYPQNQEQLFANEENYIRWDASYNSNEEGQLSVSFNDGISWQVLASNLNLNNDFFKWLTPNLFGKALLKMQIGAKDYLSKPFILSIPLTLKVGFNCNDKALLYWQSQPGAVNYTLYRIKNNVLTPISTSTDTLALINKADLGTPFFAVSANGIGFSGLKSYTIDYTMQGLSCYQQSLTAQVIDHKVKLDLLIGSTYNLKSILWEKQIGINVFSQLKVDNVDLGKLAYNTIDAEPRKGIQRYRVTFETIDGLRFQSDIISITYLGADEFVFYPNPVTQYLTVLNGSFEDYDFEVYNMMGTKVIKEKGNGTKQFDLNKCAPGLYIGVISRDGQILQKIKLIKK